jgi:hypothetical protein
MKLVNSESAVFTNMSIDSVFQILDRDRRASRSHFIVHVPPPPIKQTTPLAHIPLFHDTFSTHFDKLVKDFGQGKCFSRSKSESPNASHNQRDQ